MNAFDSVVLIERDLNQSLFTVWGIFVGIIQIKKQIVKFCLITEIRFSISYCHSIVNFCTFPIEIIK